jgi:hypothetical protein
MIEKPFTGNRLAPITMWHESQNVILLKPFRDTRVKPDDD